MLSAMRWMEVAVVSATLTCSALAEASPGRADVEATTFAWSDTQEAAAYPGAQLALSAWFGRLGLVLEGSRQAYEGGGSMSGYGLGARLELGQLPTGPPDTELSVWAEVGAARERWRIHRPLQADQSRARRRLHAGGGFSYMSPVSSSFHIGAVVWLRGQFAEAPEQKHAARRSGRPSPVGPGRRALAFGAGFLAGW